MPPKTKSQPGAGKKKIFLVDDHPVVRQGLALLINQQSDLAVCGEAEDADSAIRMIGTLQPDIAVVDLSLQGRDGLDLIKDLKLRRENLPMLVLSMLDENFYAERALRAGAKGYVMKQEAADKLLLAIRTVLKGEIYVSSKTITKMLGQFSSKKREAAQSPVELLSDRELTVFRLIGKGYSTSRIAQELHLSVKTVETHRMHMKEKLQVSDATALLQYAVKWLSSEKAD